MIVLDVEFRLDQRNPAAIPYQVSNFITNQTSSGGSYEVPESNSSLPALCSFTLLPGLIKAPTEKPWLTSQEGRYHKSQRSSAKAHAVKECIMRD